MNLSIFAEFLTESWKFKSPFLISWILYTISSFRKNPLFHSKDTIFYAIVCYRQCSSQIIKGLSLVWDLLTKNQSKQWISVLLLTAEWTRFVWIQSKQYFSTILLKMPKLNLCTIRFPNKGFSENHFQTNLDNILLVLHFAF